MIIHSRKQYPYQIYGNYKIKEGLCFMSFWFLIFIVLILICSPVILVCLGILISYIVYLLRGIE